MTIKEAITLFGYHQRSSHKPRTIQSYRPLLQTIEGRFAGRSFDSLREVGSGKWGQGKWGQAIIIKLY